MNIYHFCSSETWWDDDNEYFVVDDDELCALNTLHEFLAGDEPDYSKAADPEAWKKSHTELVAANMDRFKEGELFVAIALPDAERGVLYSVFTPG